MARQRDPRREEAFQLWKKHNGKIKNRAIAEELDVPEKTVSAWKSRDNWNEVLQTDERSTTKEKVARTQQQRRKKSGNPSPENTFSERNSKALKHGLFSRYMPQETLNIMGMIAGSDPTDLLWIQIELQFAAIIRAQEIMFVEDKDDMTRVIKKTATAEGLESTEWDIQYAWDKQATFMNAQSKAMGELRGLIKQFDEMAHIDDERRLKLQVMQGSIDKTKAEIEKLNGNNDDGPIEIMISRKGGR